jgi:hypothetical protein
MKLKGINPFEQHVEQIVLVAVSGIFLVVIAAQFLIEPNRIKVGNGQPVSPGKAFADAQARAQMLDGKIKVGAAPEDVSIPEVKLAEQVREQLAGPVAAQARLETPLGPGMQLREVHETPIGGNEQLAAVTLPAPSHPAARAFRGTIDPTEPANNPALAALLPKQQPMDKAAVSVEASFSGQALRDALGAAAQGGKPMPANWWANRTAILAVRLEREELAGEDNWTNATEIPPAPGRIDGVERAKTLTGTQDMDDLVAELRGAEDEVLRAPYYRIIAGQAWVAPSEQPVLAASTPREITNLVQDLKRARTQHENTARQLEDLNKAPSRQAPGAGGGGGGKGRGAAGAGAPAGDPKDADRKRYQGMLDNLQKRIDGDIAKLKEKGYDENGQPLKKEVAPPVDPNQPQNKARGLLDQPAIRVWAHDLTAEAGKTYRYRVKLAINNPAFGRAAALIDNQKNLAKESTLWTQPSEWTVPVSVPADRYYFITSATETNNLGPARASAEMYQFFYGYYRKGVVSMEPGDPLMAKVNLPPAEKLPIYDLAKPMADGNNPNNPAPAAAQPEGGQRGGGKGGAQAGGPGMAPPQPGQPDPAKVALPANASKWDTPIIASEDVFLLDVQKVPSADGPRLLAVLRDKDGHLTTRAPDEAGDVYKLVAASAKEGESQGQPVLPDPEKQRPQAPIPQPGKGTQPPPPPSGGGGSGGG